MTRADATLGTVIFAAAAAVQPWVASDPLVHMLVQFPLLGGVGFALGRRISLPERWTGAAVIIGIATVFFWMLPRSLDSALTSWTMHLAKFTTLPLAAGLPLTLAWPRLHRVLRGFVKAETISMLGVLGFLYTHAPIRICNSYLITDQVRLGFGFFWVAAALAILWSLPVFLGPSFTWHGPYLASLKTRTLQNDLR